MPIDVTLAVGDIQALIDGLPQGILRGSIKYVNRNNYVDKPAGCLGK